MTGIVFYTDRFVGEGFAGCTRGPIVFIRPKYMCDMGLLAHEQTHVKQWIRTLGMHSFLYLFSKSYRLKAEVEAYKVQLAYYPDDRSDLFAWFIANNYGLSITKNEAKELLK